MADISKNSVSLAGEYAVLSQLAVRGYVASMTMGNTKHIDILVFDPRAEKTYQIEVKTNFEKRRGTSNSKLFGNFVTDWQMGLKHEQIESKTLFYCFVHINSHPDRPREYKFRFFVVPSAVVAGYVREEHELWLKDSPSHQPNDRRLFRIGLPNDREIAVPAPLASLYEDNWQLLPTPAVKVSETAN